MRVELHPDARTELRSAALWYEERRPGLGEELVAQVTATFTRIGQAPMSYAQWPGTEATSTTIRKAVVSRFPYVVAFEVHTEKVLVLAVAHAKRRPLYWLSRTSRGPG